MKRLLIRCDMDGIVVDLLGHWLRTINAEHGTSVTKDDIRVFRMERNPALAGVGKKAIFDILHRPTFFADALPVPGAIAGLTALHDDGHRVTLLTALPASGDLAAVARDAKLSWVRRYLPWMDSGDVVFAAAGDKSQYPADVFIDDRPETLTAYAKVHPSALVMGISYPYNTHAASQRVILFPSHRRPEVAWGRMVGAVEDRATGGAA